MATTITFACGHTVDCNLTGRRPFQVERIVATMSRRPCRACDPATTARQVGGAARHRAGELRDARATEARFGLLPLPGSDQISDWATTIRAQLIDTAYHHLALDDDTFADQIAEPADRIQVAGWWLYHRAMPVDQLAAALRHAHTHVGNR